MSNLNLNEKECGLLIAEGWQLSDTSGDPDFYMDFGQRQIQMWPVFKRLLTPKIFRSQAMRYDSEYSGIAMKVGWGGRKSFGTNNKTEAMRSHKIDFFDAAFAKQITQALTDYAVNADPAKEVAASIERRKTVRKSLTMADFIDYAYVRRTDDLLKISLKPSENGSEYVVEGENPERLMRAIEISQRL